MKKLSLISIMILACLFVHAQKVKGSWNLISENAFLEMTIAKNITVTPLKNDGKAKNMTFIVKEIISRKKEKKYICTADNEEKYGVLIFFKVKKYLKLLPSSKSYEEIGQAKAFKRKNNLGIWMYTKKQFEAFKKLKSLNNISKDDMKSVLKKTISYLEAEAKKNNQTIDELNDSVKISEMAHNLIKKGYAPALEDVDFKAIIRKLKQGDEVLEKYWKKIN